GVGGEEYAGVRQVVRYVAGSVAGRVENLDFFIAEIDGRAFAYRIIDAWNLCRLGLGSDDLQAEALLQGEIGLHMVGMVMGDEQQLRLPAGALDRLQNGLFLRGVDQGHVTRLGI